MMFSRVPVHYVLRVEQIFGVQSPRSRRERAKHYAEEVRPSRHQAHHRPHVRLVH